MKRIYKIDIIKGFLIFFVVLGHVIERIDTRNEIYNLIYSFHMPLFVLITGMTFKKYIDNINIKIILIKVGVPYIVFQIFYTLIYGSNIIGWKYLLVPYYHMWYLFSLIIWFFGTIILKNYINKYTISLFFILGILINFLDINFNILSISRSIIFFPYFLLGYTLGIPTKETNSKRHYIFIVIIIITIIIYLKNPIPNKILWGTYSYKTIFESNILEKSIFYKMYFYIYSLLISWCLIEIIPNKKIKLAYLGNNTISVYLWHLFFILILKEVLFYLNIKANIIIDIFLSICIIIFINLKKIKESGEKNEYKRKNCNS